MICLILQIFSGIVFFFAACVFAKEVSDFYNKKDYIGCLLGLVLIIYFTVIGLGLLTIF